MKRAALAVLGTIAGLVALLQFKTGPGPTSIAATVPTTELAPSGTPAGTTGAPPTSAQAAPTTTQAPATTSQAAPTSASSSASTGGTRTVPGTAVDTPYGTVQVQLTVHGSTISDVKFLKLDAFDRRSAEINNYAAPVLVQETLKAQSATIDTVSGATYTSEGYIQSLQSALDKAGIR